MDVHAGKKDAPIENRLTWVDVLLYPARGYDRQSRALLFDVDALFGFSVSITIGIAISGILRFHSIKYAGYVL